MAAARSLQLPRPYLLTKWYGERRCSAVVVGVGAEDDDDDEAAAGAAAADEDVSTVADAAWAVTDEIDEESTRFDDVDVVEESTWFDDAVVVDEST